jgi:hypothetical protein
MQTKQCTRDLLLSFDGRLIGPEREGVSVKKKKKREGVMLITWFAYCRRCRRLFL